MCLNYFCHVAFTHTDTHSKKVICVSIGDAFKEFDCIGENDRNKLVKVTLQFIINELTHSG